MLCVSIAGLGSQDIFRRVFPLTTSRCVYRCISWLNTSQLPRGAEESQRPKRERETSPIGPAEEIIPPERILRIHDSFMSSLWINEQLRLMPLATGPRVALNRRLTLTARPFAQPTDATPLEGGVCPQRPRVILTLTSVSFILCSSKVGVNLFFL